MACTEVEYAFAHVISLLDRSIGIGYLCVTAHKLLYGRVLLSGQVEDKQNKKVSIKAKSANEQHI